MIIRSKIFIESDICNIISSKRHLPIKEAAHIVYISHVKPLEDELTELKTQYNEIAKTLAEENTIIIRYGRYKSCLADDPDFVKLCDVLEKTASDLRPTHDVYSWGIAMTVEYIKESAIELAAAKERIRELEAAKAAQVMKIKHQTKGG